MSEIELLQGILDRLDLIYTCLLYFFSGCVCVLVLFLLYRFLKYFF